ncbi:MAG: glycosyltransferase [Patescibacteria group bacterium]
MDLILFILCLIPVSVLSINFFSVILTWFYQKHHYPKTIRPKFDQKLKPFCSLIIAVKGTSSTLDKHLKSFITQKYSNYEIIFAVESKTDPAYQHIKKAISGHRHAKLVVAHSCRLCSQKNQNLLTALNHTNHPEILVFADADITVQNNWLTELILPLSDPNITATTSYYWPKISFNSIGELFLLFNSSIIFSLLCFASSYMKFSLLWGGSIAIRHKTFEKLKVAKYWSHSVSDDTSLSKILSDNNHQTLFVPTAVSLSATHSADFDTYNRWYFRQLMYLKLYRKRIWFFIFGLLNLYYFIFYFWFVLSFSLSQFDEYTFRQFGGYIPTVFIAIEMILASLHALLGPIPKYPLYIILSPYFRLVQIFGYMTTYLTNRITWSGITYQTTSDGRVIKIKK